MIKLGFPLMFLTFLVQATHANTCQTSAKILLSSEFVPKLFAELRNVVYAHKATITNVEVNGMLGGWSEAGQNPRVLDLFEVANAVGASVADLFQHAGNLKNHIDPEKIIKNKPVLTGARKQYIFTRTHLHLSGLIEQMQHDNNLSLEGLAGQIGVMPKLLHQIVLDAGLPRVPTLLKLLVKLDADPVDFFKHVEMAVQQLQISKQRAKSQYILWNNRESEQFAQNLFDRIDSDLNQIFENFSLEYGTDIMRFRNMFRQRGVRLRGSKRNKKLTLPWILQIAHILGVNPSVVLKHAGNLKEHAKLAGIEQRDLLTPGEINVFLRRIHKHFVETVTHSKVTLEELSQKIEVSRPYLKNIFGWREMIPRYSVMERILQTLDSDSILFLEKLESLKEIGIDSSRPGTMFALQRNSLKKSQAYNQFIGRRILEVGELLASVISPTRLGLLTVKSVDTQTGKGLTQRKIHFASIYKFSRVTHITLSELVSEAPVKDLVKPNNIKIEQISREELDRAKRLLTHLLLNEARRQRDLHDLTLSGLAIKSHLFIRNVRRTLLGEMTPSVPVLRQIVEDGWGIPLDVFLRNFEAKLKNFDRIPLESKVVLAELEGVYFSPRVLGHLEQLRERFNQAIEFLKSVNIPLSELKKSTGIEIAPVRQKNNIGYGQVYTIVKFSHFLGISMRDFLGHQNFSDLVAIDRINFNRLSENRLGQAVAQIKNNINQRKEDLGLSEQDFKIMMGMNESRRVAFIFGESILSFSWPRYFQAAEILALRLKGEDDLFLLDGVVF